VLRKSRHASQAGGAIIRRKAARRGNKYEAYQGYQEYQEYHFFGEGGAHQKKQMNQFC
jgi:hypothetical protein